MPDGRVVLDAGGGRFELVRMTVDGGSMVRLTTNWGVNLYPAWSPDGRRIGYVSDAELVDRTTSGARVSLYTMAADGSDVRPVLDDDFPALHYPPAWSPDGENLAVVRYGESKMGFASSITNIGRDLYVVGADGQNPRLVAGNVVSGPSWSPDGQRLAIAQAEEDGVGLYIIGIDGTGSRRVTGIEGWQGPSRTRVAMDSADPAEAWIGTVAWSPDGTRILVRSNQSYPVLVVSVETGKAIDVGSGFQPAGAHIGVRAAAWSPDGSRIAMTGGGKVEQGEAPHIVGTVAADGTDVKVLALVGAGDVLVAERAQEPDVVASQAKCSDGTLVSDPAGNAGLVRDCEVLLGLRDALFGESGKKLNWSPGTPMTEWLGVTIAGTPPRVTALELVGSIVRGRLPSAVGDLSALRVLELIGSFLPGPIPAELGGLAQLRTLRLASAHLRGPIPPAFGQLTNLETLDLGGNFLTGTIPPELGRLASLETLDLSRNALSGAIPVELSHLVNLRTLHLESNELNGRIPPELGRLPNLERVALDGNHRLTGCVPLELPVDDPASGQPHASRGDGSDRPSRVPHARAARPAWRGDRCGPLPHRPVLVLHLAGPASESRIARAGEDRRLSPDQSREGGAPRIPSLRWRVQNLWQVWAIT